MDRYVVGDKEYVVIDGKVFVEAQRVSILEQGFAALEKMTTPPTTAPPKKPLKKVGRKSKVDWKVAIKRIQDGDDVRAVADDVGVSYSAVLYQLKKRGISKKTAQKQREDATARGLSMNTLHCNACDHEWDTAMNSDETVCMSCGSNSLITI